MRLNKKSRKLELRYIVIIVILVITLFIGLLSLLINDNRKLSPVEKVFKDVIVHVEKYLYFPFRYIGDKITTYKESVKLYHKYKEDTTKLEEAKKIKEENIELKKEIASMKELLSLQTTLTEYDKINAMVVNRNVGVWYNTLTINKGSNNGIKNDMIVVTSKGLIGRIIKTSYFSSDVKLITTNDINSKISVAIVTNSGNTYGLLSGYDPTNHLLIIEGITDASNIKNDDSVITSGLSNLFPKGITVGKVKDISSSEFGISKIIKVSTEVDFNDLRYVSVLKRVK